MNDLNDEYKKFNTQGWETVKMIAGIVLVLILIICCVVKVIMK